MPIVRKNGTITEATAINEIGEGPPPKEFLDLAYKIAEKTEKKFNCKPIKGTTPSNYVKKYNKWYYSIKINDPSKISNDDEVIKTTRTGTVLGPGGLAAADSVKSAAARSTSATVAKYNDDGNKLLASIPGMKWEGEPYDHYKMTKDGKYVMHASMNAGNVGDKIVVLSIEIRCGEPTAMLCKNRLGIDKDSLMESGSLRNNLVDYIENYYIPEAEYFNEADDKDKKVNLTFKLTPMEEIPKDYYKSASNLFKAIQDVTKDKVGEGVGDAATGAFFSNKKPEDILNSTNKNAFVFIIPKGITLALPLSTPKKWRDMADEILRKADFKKGAADTVIDTTYYWYKYSPDKKNIYVAYYVAPNSLFFSTQLQLSVRCVTNTEDNKFVLETAILEAKLKASKRKKLDETEFGLPKKKKYPLNDENHVRSAIRFFNHCDPDDEEELAKNIKKKIKKFGMKNIEISDKNRFSKYYNESAPIHGYYNGYQEAQKVISEYFDLSDTTTRREIVAMDEADHNSLLTSLTTKLYDHIVKKSMDIDFGDIPKSKGDITKVACYEDLLEVLSILKDILKQYREDSTPVDTISTAIANIKTRKDMFVKAFSMNCELPMLMYNTVVLSIINGTSYLIAACIEFIKAPRDETYTIQLDKIAYAKSKDHLMYQSLDKFNKSCEKGDFDNAMQAVIDKKVRRFTGSVVAGIIGGTVIGVIIVLSIIPILRELTYILYHTRVQMADFFEVQADLITMNTYNIEHNSTIDPVKKSEIVDKQSSIASKFRDIANKLSIDSKKTDVEASKEIQNTKKKYKIDEIEEELPSDEPSSSALF